MADESKNLEPVKEEVELVEGVERTRPRKVFVPRATIYETDELIQIVLDMPGVSSDNVDINLEKNELSITGLVPNEEPEGFTLHYNEYVVGDYERSFVIPNDIDRDKINAVMKDGVLRVTLEKSQAARSRKVSVKAG
ncbi:MAG: Hsp20/alpha crystallin family protein [Anaerolineaceae bacterium]|nr:Hsp20/alpha crystallin family protein [Anaerolineaceae bacterium]